MIIHFIYSFGSLIRSRKSGVIFNNEMNDFSYPTRSNPNSYKQTELNYIEPGKRPLSSMAPTIIHDDDGKVRMVVGASGGFKITTAVAQVNFNPLDYYYYSVKLSAHAIWVHEHVR
jgi:gamma-glutamyltranspeptidase